MMKQRIFALGFFDGVHLGHQVLLRECAQLAARENCEAAAITFDRHPRSLFLSDAPVLISTLPDRLRLLSSQGIQYTRVFPVTQDTMATPWEDFLDLLLRDGAAGFVCGEDFRFGCRGEGNARLLEGYCRERGLPCLVVSQQTLGGIRISSTYIRRQIEQGDMATAVQFLGHPLTLTGTVVRGQQLGRRLGIPTANLRLPRGLAVPRFGVYACRCLVDGCAYAAVTNVGTRPTVAGEGITVEPWILDYTGDLYGRDITLEFFCFLRGEEKFPSLEALQRQIHADAEQTRAYLSSR